MLSFKVLLSTVFVLAAICYHSEAKKGPKVLTFVKDNYGKALSEYHQVDVKVLHVHASGGNGKIQYSIKEKDTPFTIDDKGRIRLRKPLNSEIEKSYILNIIAKISGSKEVATARVRFDIMNMNKHTPQFNESQYICAVTENTRKVSVLPQIRIHDEDRGDAGKLHHIDVIESHIPFKFTVKKNGDVEVVTTEDLDAEKVSGFSFDIKAWDSGDPRRASQPARVDCKVVDANEFTPEFTSYSYTAEVKRGQLYRQILQVEAIDKDIGKEYGSVCKYIIRTVDVPFKITNEGVLYLDTALGPESPDYCAFEIAAVDCGGKMSLNTTSVRINIKDDCKKGFIAPSFSNVYIPQCVGRATVVPDIRLNECSRDSSLSKFSADIELTSPVAKGCDRQRYQASDVYKLCGASYVTDLLPKYGRGREWTRNLRIADGVGDDAIFEFDGRTVVDIPSEVFPQDFGENFTVSFWIKLIKQHEHLQVIVAATDAKSHNRMHFAVYTKGSHLVVVHRMNPWQGERNDLVKSVYRYQPNIFNKKWHHITVVVRGPNVMLYVDGERRASDRTNPNFRLHKSHIPIRLVVGAHWLGKEGAYTNHFKGALAGMTIRPNRVTSRDIIRCVSACREHINIETVLPRGFTSTMNGFGSLRISGKGSPEDFQTIIQNIEYQNDLFAPTPGLRKFKIVTMQDGFLFPPVNIDVNIKKNTKPVITLEGCDEIKANLDTLKGIGVPVCSKLVIHYSGCKVQDSPVNVVKFLDRAVVRVTPKFTKNESINFSKGLYGHTILDDLELDASPSEDGIVIRGVANSDAYVKILRDMKYINTNPSMDLYRTFTIFVSDQSGRFNSDMEVLHLSPKKNMPKISKEKYEELRPFNLQAIDATLNKEEQLPGAVSVQQGVATVSKSSVSAGIMAVIIIASASVFLILVLLGVYKLRKTATKLEVPAEQNEKEEMYWDDTGLSGVRITVNPLQKFQELDLNEDHESENGHSDDEDNQQAKKSLEWDESAM